MGACHSKRIEPEVTEVTKLPYNITNRVLTMPTRYHTIPYEKNLNKLKY